ncbi:MAG: 2-C-methyl-D-erythritol 2,4-cyclodiphosphate synthase [Clostridiaceae bacterium]|jgi:2-C-methyl-D-erythritol 4-phosphate cytidylyltransferase/2-C-methyl-D-erythritol 2,4-cyclodiphosphate synthase|nr:2-C-methyl-D-erythritol 2,4-cyclodiphosphate synthase [Clostridiaceae bacterium]
MKISVIIAAGGSSSRMHGFDKLKAKIDGKSVLTRAVLPFAEYGGISEIIISAREDALPEFEALVRAEAANYIPYPQTAHGAAMKSDADNDRNTVHRANGAVSIERISKSGGGVSELRSEALKPEDGISKLKTGVPELRSGILKSGGGVPKLKTDVPEIRFTSAGATRTESVYNALLKVSPGTDFVLIHDGARPFLTSAVIRRVTETVKKFGAAVPVAPVTDSVLINGMPYPRELLRCAQTPQAFDFAKLTEAYGRALADGTDEFSDDYSLYAHFFPCGAETITAGDPENKKITYPSDLPSVHGVGYDIHAFGSGNGFPLAGVTVRHNRGVIAHSDGDAAIHALMDALLSALGKDDIGKLFPDSDPAFKGINSIELLKRVIDIVNSENAKLLNISLSILLEAPKIAPLIPSMKKVLSEVTGLPTDRIGISATTNEKTALIGNGEAVACFASVSLLR